MGTVRVGVDVGGTFTDVVAVDGDRVVVAKVPTTPDQSAGVLDALRAAGIDAAEVESLRHGTTVATNALLERTGARTALVTTEGFRDVIEIGRQNRPSLYDLSVDRPPPLVPRELRFTVRERMGPDGEIEPLDRDDVGRVARALADEDVEAVAVCFMFSHLHPGHEAEVAAALRKALSGVEPTTSSEVLPEFREYERFSTTVATAYLGRLLGTYLDRLSDRVGPEGFPAPLVMQSSGGVTDIATASRRAAACVLSGPAGGVVGAAHVARSSGFDSALSLDMGGTSTDVAAVIGGEARPTTEGVVGGVPLKVPMVDIHTVGAGGGSTAWVDEGGALRVGPRSAGANPGPAAYGRGGTEPTVTDADLYLGYMPDGGRLGGEVDLDRERARDAITALAEELGIDEEETALGIVRVVEAEMARALRVISVERGLDPRVFALVAFGGAGPMHACALARELAMSTVVIPPTSGMLSALGLALSDLRRDYVAPVAPADTDASELEEAFGKLEGRAEQDLPGADLSRLADLRYRGQSFELTVDADDLDAIESRFHEAHAERFGYRMDEEPVETIALRVVATTSTPAPETTAPSPEMNARSRRRANIDGEWREVDVVGAGALAAGTAVDGPAIVELDGSTAVVPSTWRGEVDPSGSLVLRPR